MNFTKADKSFEEKNWLNFSNKPILNLFTSIKDCINTYLENGASLNNIKCITACDSQRRGTDVTYVTTIVLINEGKGGNVFYIKEYENYSHILTFENTTMYERKLKIKSLMQKRLWSEASKAVNCALWVNSLCKPLNIKVSEVHVDINTNKKYRSSELYNGIIGFIESCGFIPKAKPDSWAASGIANSKTK